MLFLLIVLGIICYVCFEELSEILKLRRQKPEEHTSFVP